MTEETTVPSSGNKGHNTTGLVALILAVIGLVLTISIIAAPLGIVLLVVAFLLGIIGLFKAPRGKALAGIIISLVSFFAIGYTVYWTIGNVYAPMKAFIFWMDEEAKTNTEFRLVFKQPGFESFLEGRMKERIRNIDLSTTLKIEKPTKLLSFYVTFFLDELQDEIPLAIDAWIERYGIPAPEDDLIGIDPFTSRPDEWRMDDDRELGSGFSREEIDILMEDNTGTMEVHAQELEQLLHELENG